MFRSPASCIFRNICKWEHSHLLLARTIVVKSPVSPVEIPYDKSLPLTILDRAAKWPDRIAYIQAETDVSYTFSDVRRLVFNMGSALQRRGFNKNDVMCFMVPNTIEQVIALFSTMLVGGVATGINTVFTPSEILTRLNDYQSAHVIASPSMLPRIEEVSKSYKNIKNIYLVGPPMAGYQSVSDMMQEEPDVIDVDIQPKDDVAMLFYSSGTTGKPKGVMLTHHNMIASIIQSSNKGLAVMKEPGERIGCGMPFFHTAGCGVGLLRPWFEGFSVVGISNYTFSSYLKHIEKYKITTLVMPPAVLNRLAKDQEVDQYDISSVKYLIVGTAPVAPELLKQVQKRLNIKEFRVGYGLTETMGVSTITHITDTSKHVYGQVGPTTPNTEMKIIDTETGEELGYNERGEVWLKGPAVMKGYLNNPQATAETLTTDGWLKTGDVGYVNKEGKLHIVDRIKDLIKYKGFQVPPSELEDVLLSNPAVSEAGVVGVPDDQAGELPRAFIVLKPNMAVTKEYLNDLIREKLAPYKQLRGGIYFVDALPKNATGKLIRKDLMNLAVEAHYH